MRRRSGRIAVAVVLFVLGFLVVVQLKSQSVDQGLNALSVQDLTELVANLTTRNNQLRDEITTLEQQRDAIRSNVARGDSSAVQVRADLNRLRGWSGETAVVGTGIRVAVSGPIPGDALEQLLNELRNAGAEAISVGETRLVPGEVVAGPAGALSIDNSPLDDPFEISAIGNSETLTGTLTRAGGIIAQLAATYPDALLTVTPVTNLQLPATARSLAPVNGHPKL